MNQPKVKTLILDAGPLLSLSPLRGLSESYYTVPQVLGELKDDKARAHFQNLGLSAGVKVEVRVPDTAAIAKGNVQKRICDGLFSFFMNYLSDLRLVVTLAAKKSGDFAVLSVADIHVIALTYALHQDYINRKPVQEEEVCLNEILLMFI